MLGGFLNYAFRLFSFILQYFVPQVPLRRLLPNNLRVVATGQRQHQLPHCTLTLQVQQLAAFICVRLRSLLAVRNGQFLCSAAAGLGCAGA